VAFPKGQGCLVCHSDRWLKKDKRSIYVNPDIFHASVHGKKPCAKCHLGFNISGEPHQNTDIEPRKIAALACKDCHKKVLEKYKQSSHGKLVLEKGDLKAARCGDCHGSHNIKKFKEKGVKEAFRSDALKICGKCHKNYVDSWNDYYHGRAFKVGKFSKAPVCWTCHKGYEESNNHAYLPKKDPKSSINPENLPTTCGQCHVGATRAFTDGYAPMIHGRKKIQDGNFLVILVRKAYPGFLRIEDK
jgi:5-methylcytosine-specific restriction endonuclease McrA